MAWSLVHGIAKLAISGKLSFTRKKVLDFTEHASTAFISGMREEGGNFTDALQKKRG